MNSYLIYGPIPVEALPEHEPSLEQISLELDDCILYVEHEAHMGHSGLQSSSMELDRWAAKMYASSRSDIRIQLRGRAPDWVVFGVAGIDPSLRQGETPQQHLEA